MEKTDCCLVIGAGSIGERYIRNLWSLGYRNMVVLRTRNLPFRDVGQAQVSIKTTWEQVEQLNPAVAFVCNPTSMHLPSAMECIKRGIPVLVEKPLSHSTDGLDELSDQAHKKNILVQVGYMMRYHPLIKRISDIISSRLYGNLLQMQSHWGEYLPDWHPWENYKDSYAANRAMGGGVALTLSHDLDLANWLAGAALVQYKRLYNFRSSLKVDVESGADFLLQYKNGVNAQVHLNYFQRTKERWYNYIFDDASIRIDFFRSEMLIQKPDGVVVEQLENFDRNDLFIEQIKDFLASVAHPEKSMTNIAESKQIINLCTANE
jgi:predicted dehydrogenase